jgi:2-oxoglutarate dehydrogenase E2 component (dihydrolipoamide succinyltransferase)
MPIELVVPKVGESITEVEIGDWLKKEGDSVSVDESIVVIDTAKATVELPAPAAGRITKILKQTGESANVGDIIGYLEAGDAAAAPASGSEGAKAGEQAPEWKAPVDSNEQPHAEVGKAAPDKTKSAKAAKGETVVMPAAQRVLAENALGAADVKSSGPGGRLLNEDVQAHVAAQADGAAAVKAAPQAAAAPEAGQTAPLAGEDEEVVPMSMLRRVIASRLVEAQQTAALLTTFNEIDMSAAMAMRKEHQETFQKRYGIKLGFMSFFVKAAIDALKQYPAVNAEIRGKNIVYKNHYDIGVAIGGGKGLVVPVLRNADRLSFAEIENSIAELAGRVKDNTLSPEALEGGTFTITNGGIYGSLLSTPIVNPPQSGILGMHSIQERPIALNGQVVIRPMMYVALTYDHRIVDGREAVSFLKRLKDCVENPARMLIEV